MTHIGVLSTALLVSALLPILAAVVRLETRAVRRVLARRTTECLPPAGRTPECLPPPGRTPGCLLPADDVTLRVLDEWMGAPSWAPVPAARPRIEEVAADLRRLGRQRLSGPSCESVRWRDAVLRAYDDRLSLASDALGVRHQLSALAGMDLELERLRVEEELTAAGMKLR
ncbi:hypothetical protein [Actinoplanes sp. RD1]|uniref:hypothetical protein n=1 Tax=Actinoplanes sp. RD1 TaxID=3064538 RepID=UPI00274214A9|nr:hypothetical protein [Actinoplanes sp. RD1]